MNILGNRTVKIGLITLAFIAIGINFVLFRNANLQATPLASITSGPVAVQAPLKDYDLQGKIPGNPAQTVTQMGLLYKYIEIYRKRHNGAYPNRQGKDQSQWLDQDMFDHWTEYGFKTPLEAAKSLKNPDVVYWDSVHNSPNPENVYPYLSSGTRPDGQPLGAPKAAGARDVVAWTEIYFHRNIRYLKDGATPSKPAGFYLVLWDDGQVEQVPYNKAKYLGPQRSYPYQTVFEGQAGLPKTGVHTYDEYQKWKRDNL